MGGRLAEACAVAADANAARHAAEVESDVREIVFPLIDSGKEVHLNLKDVQYMDSSGISVIIESNQRAREKNTKVELKEVSQPVEKVLAMARKFL